jgi:L-asparagine transporter-like permease
MASTDDIRTPHLFFVYVAMYRSFRPSLDIDFRQTFLYVAGISSTLIIFKFAMFDVVQSSIVKAKQAQDKKAKIEMEEYDARKFRENNVIMSRVHAIVAQEEARIELEEAKTSTLSSRLL